MIKNILKNTLLTLTVIFLIIALLFVIQHIFIEPQEDLDALFGLLMIASFFGVPYLIFFKLRSNKGSKNKEANNKQSFVSKRCTYCNSSVIVATKDGFKCEHCGSKYS